MSDKSTRVCPQCHKKFQMINPEVRPFCSEKCKLIDLGKWLNESYVVEGPEMPFIETEFEGMDDE